MATGARHYGDIRATAQKWLEEVEIPANGSTTRRPPFPAVCSSSQIAATAVTHPKLVYGRANRRLDVSVQARLLDSLRGPVVELNSAVVIVTHDLGVASPAGGPFCW